MWSSLPMWLSTKCPPYSQVTVQIPTERNPTEWFPTPVQQKPHWENVQQCKNCSHKQAHWHRLTHTRINSAPEYKHMRTWAEKPWLSINTQSSSVCVAIFVCIFVQSDSPSGRKHARERERKREREHEQEHTHTHTHARTHNDTYWARTRTYTRARALYTHNHTHTHTHTHVCREEAQFCAEGIHIVWLSLSNLHDRIRAVGFRKVDLERKPSSGSRLWHQGDDRPFTRFLPVWSRISFFL